MSTTHRLNHQRLAADPEFAGLAGQLTQFSTIDSRDAFNRYCREACRLWREHFPIPVGRTTELFTRLLQRVERHGNDVIPTSWGGVAVERHVHPEVEKYLVVQKGGYLALETHEEKDEHLLVVEGAGLIVAQNKPDGPLAALPLAPGDRFHFLPGELHCLIGTENLLVFERSTDPMGMDQDLIFLFEPDDRDS